MSESQRVVVSNAGPLMVLGKLNRLHLLADLYQEVQITQAVYAEVVTGGLARGAPDALVVQLYWRQTGWPVVTVVQALLDGYRPQAILDSGEIEILALAQTLSDPLILMDDEEARNEARRLQLRVKGSLGVLVQAYRLQLLTFAQVDLLFQEIATRPDIWISARLCKQVLERL